MQAVVAAAAFIHKKRNVKDLHEALFPCDHIQRNDKSIKAVHVTCGPSLLQCIRIALSIKKTWDVHLSVVSTL